MSLGGLAGCAELVLPDVRHSSDPRRPRSIGGPTSGAARPTGKLGGRRVLVDRDGQNGPVNRRSTGHRAGAQRTPPAVRRVCSRRCQAARAARLLPLVQLVLAHAKLLAGDLTE